MKEFAVILISHGYYAREALASAEMIVGKQTNVKVISVTNDKDLEHVLKEINETYEKLDTSEGLLILADILGGTPSNVAGNIVLTKENVHAITGFNLSILLELFLNRKKPLQEMLSILKDTYDKSFNHLNDILNKEEEDNEY